MKVQLKYITFEGEIVRTVKTSVQPLGDTRADEQAKLTEISTFGSKMKKLLEGATGITKSVVGIGIACENVIEARRAACDICSIRDGEKCGSCGCYLEHKTRLAVSECPEGYWGPAEVCKKEEQGK
jgi:hypothetical protein